MPTNNKKQNKAPETISFDVVSSEMQNSHIDRGCVLQSAINEKESNILLTIDKNGLVTNAYVVNYDDTVKTDKPVAVLGVNDDVFLHAGYYNGESEFKEFDEASKHAVGEAYYSPDILKNKNKISMYEQEQFYKFALNCCEDAIKEFAVYADQNEITQRVIKKYLNDCMEDYKVELEKRNAEFDDYIAANTSSIKSTKENNITISNHRINTVIPNMEESMRIHSNELLFQYAETYRRKYAEIKNDKTVSGIEQYVASEREKCMEYVQRFSEQSNLFVRTWSSELLDSSLSSDVIEENKTLIRHMGNSTEAGYNYISQRLQLERKKLFDMEKSGLTQANSAEFAQQMKFVKDLANITNLHPHLQDNTSYRSFNYQIYCDLSSNHKSTIAAINNELKNQLDSKYPNLQLNIDGYHSVSELKYIKEIAKKITPLDNQDEFIELIDKQIAQQSFHFASDNVLTHISEFNSDPKQRLDPVGGVNNKLSAEYANYSQRDYYDHLRVKSAFIELVKNESELEKLRGILNDESKTLNEKNDLFHQKIIGVFENHDIDFTNSPISYDFIKSQEFASILSNPESIYMTTSIKGVTQTLSVDDSISDSPKLEIGKEKTLKPEYCVNYLNHDITEEEGARALYKEINRAKKIDLQFRDPQAIKTHDEFRFITEFIAHNMSEKKENIRHFYYNGMDSQSHDLSSQIIGYLADNPKITELISKTGIDVNQVSSGVDKYRMIDSLITIAGNKNDELSLKIREELIPLIKEDASTQYHYTRGVDHFARLSDGSINTNNASEFDKYMAKSLDLSTALNEKNAFETYEQVLNTVIDNQNNRSAIIDQINSVLANNPSGIIEKLTNMPNAMKDPKDFSTFVQETFELHKVNQTMNINSTFIDSFINSTEFKTALDQLKELSSKVDLSNTNDSNQFTINLRKANNINLLADIYNDARKLDDKYMKGLFMEGKSIDDPSVLEYLRDEASKHKKFNKLVENIDSLKNSNQCVNWLALKYNTEQLMHSGNLTREQYRQILESEKNYATMVAINESADGNCFAVYNAIKENQNQVLVQQYTSPAMESLLIQRRSVLDSYVEKLANQLDGKNPNNLEKSSGPALAVSGTIIFDSVSRGQSEGYKLASNHAYANAMQNNLHTQIQKHPCYVQYHKLLETKDIQSEIQSKSILPDTIIDRKNNFDMANINSVKTLAVELIKTYAGRDDITIDNITTEEFNKLHNYRYPAELHIYVGAIQSAMAKDELEMAQKVLNKANETLAQANDSFQKAQKEYSKDENNDIKKQSYEEAKHMLEQTKMDCEKLAHHIGTLESRSTEFNNKYNEIVEFNNLTKQYTLVNSIMVASRDLSASEYTLDGVKNVETSSISIKLLETSTDKSIETFAKNLSAISYKTDDINNVLKLINEGATVDSLSVDDRKILNIIQEYNKSIERLNNNAKNEICNILSDKLGVSYHTLEKTFSEQLFIPINTADGKFNEFMKEVNLPASTGVDHKADGVSKTQQKHAIENFNKRMKQEKDNHYLSDLTQNTLNNPDNVKDFQKACNIALYISKNGIDEVCKDKKNIQKDKIKELLKSSIQSICESCTSSKNVITEQCLNHSVSDEIKGIIHSAQKDYDKSNDLDL